MALIRAACFAFLVIFLAKPVLCQQIFDVTKFGAKGDGTTDDTKAFSEAWRATCTTDDGATMVVPAGTFLIGPIVFLGPCAGRPTVEIKGTIKAQPELSAYPEDVWIEFRAVEGIIIQGGGVIDGQGGAEAWKTTKCPEQRECKNMPTSLRLATITNGTVSDLTLVDSKGFHMKVQRSNHIIVQHMNITAPGYSPNTDGIHISDTNHINVTEMNIATGDDCVSIGSGAIYVDISKVTCGPGHGISIGSLGKFKDEKDVSFITVTNCTLSNTDNGVRIKTWPGSPSTLATHFRFEDVVMNNVSNPIIIDQVYCPVHHCSSMPSMVKIKDVTFKNIRGTSQDPVAVNLVCSPAVPCEGVNLEDIHLEHVDGKAISSTCSHVQGSPLGEILPTSCL